MLYEFLISQYSQLTIKEVSLPRGLYGLYYDNVVEIDKHKSNVEKHCILAEELGHYETTHGDIIDLSSIRNKKLEITARRWGYKKIVSLDKLIECFKNHFTTLDEVCNHLEVTPEYLQSSLEFYKERYGLFLEYKKYKIYFDPLNIEFL